MKYFRNLFVMAIFIMSAFFMGEIVVNAEAMTLNNPRVICDKDSLEPGEYATCYYIAASANKKGKLDGYVSVGYSSLNLEITGAGQLDKLSDVESVYVLNKQKAPSSAVTSNSRLGGDSSSGIPEFECTTSSYAGHGIASSQIKTQGCVVTYTKGGTAKIEYGTDTGHSFSKYYANAERDGWGEYFVVAIYKVRLDPKSKTTECGKICIQAWTIPESTYYGMYNHGACTTATDAGCNGADSISIVGGGSAGNCTEIHYTGTPADNPHNGAFVSYILLAAGAFIAICAVAISKKNNKLYKV